MQETQVQFLGWEDPLEKEMATHSSIFAWRIPWTEEPGRLQSMGFQKLDMTNMTKPPPTTENKEAYLDNHQGLQDTKSQGRLNNKTDFLNKTTPSRVGEVTVLSRTQKPTQRVTDDEATEKYVPNERIN